MSERMTLRKLAMLSVKAGVGLFPKKVKEWFRRSPYLTSLYSRNLQKSGLFYGFPSRKKLEALYTVNIQQQEQLISSLKVTDDTFLIHVIILVPQGRCNLIGETLKSAREINWQNLSVTVLCCTGDLHQAISQVQDANVLCISNADDLPIGPSLIIEAGWCCHSEIIHVANAYSTSDECLTYFDCDRVEHGKRVEPKFYPDWNPDLHLSTAYIRGGIWLKCSSFLNDFTFEPSEQCISLLLTQMYFKRISGIRHIPLTLMHQHSAKDLSLSEYASVTEKVSDGSIKVQQSDFKHVLSCSWQHNTNPLVSLIIPTKNAKALVKACVESILEKTTYLNYEIILVDNQSDEPDSLEYFKQLDRHPKVRVLTYPYPFNYSAINNFAAKNAYGEIIGLVNNDIEVISPAWLDYMVGNVQRRDIGCVGAKLLYSDGRIQHAGVVMGYGGGAGHAHKYFPRYHSGYLNRLAATGNYSAVTAACLLVKKEDYWAVGGLEESLEVAFNDVDFCLKVAQLGRFNLYCAEAELFHHESVSRGFDDTHEKRARFERELDYLKSKWFGYIERDPAYNSNLTLSRENFAIKEC